MAREWHCHFHTTGAFESLPRLLAIGAETVGESSYRYEGRRRSEADYIHLQYTLSGMGIYEDATGRYEVSAGKGFMGRVRDPSSAYWYPPGSGQPWRFVFVCFRGGGVDHAVKEMTRRFGPVYDVPREDEMIRGILNYGGERHRYVEVGALEGARFVQGLILDLASRAEVKAPEIGARERVVSFARGFVRLHSSRSLSVGDVARAAGISREHLTRLFSEHLGETPGCYIRRQRVLRACKLLKERDLSVKEVAARLEFTSHAQFSRVFRDVMRMTPTQFKYDGVLPLVE